MPSIDIDAVLIAIRIASYGESMEVNSGCPECGHHNEYNLDLLSFLDKSNGFTYKDTVSVGQLTIKLRPYNYKELTKAAIKTFEQQKLISIVTNEDLSEEDKIAKFGESFVNLTRLTVDVVVNCIESVETPDGIVSDKEMIREFMENTSSEIFNLVNDQVREMKDLMALKAHDVECQECSHKFTVEVAMDQTNFFVVGS
jgi:DNA-directed RNA polymerase subunit RPC12/RpoP